MCESKEDKLDELFVRILHAAASIKEREGRLHQYSIFVQKFQSPLWMTVAFWNIYYEAQQIYYFCVTNLLLNHKIRVKRKINFRVN